MAELIMCGVITPLVQNRAYALPPMRCAIYVATGAQTFEQAMGEGFTENTQVQLVNGQAFLNGAFIRCTTGTTPVMIVKAGG